MPDSELDLFRRNLGYAREMASTATALSAQLTAALDLSDLLRASLVQGVSAFDHFVHEEVRARMVLSWTADPCTRPSAMSRFRVSLDSVEQALASPGCQWLEEEIRSQHGHLSFQHPDRLAEALRLVTSVDVWSSLASALARDSQAVKLQLKVIVDRRNKIAHEADVDPTPPRTRYPIRRQDVEGSLDFLHDLGSAIADLP